jgi:multidrug transporter EmrE-like cation transporter
MRLILAILPTMLLVVYGQLVIKWRVAALSGPANPADGTLGRLLSYLGDPYILSAYVAALVSSITWMFVVESYAVSLAFPLHIGLTVLAVVIGGVYLFGEPITASRIVAVCLILAGIAVGSRS